MANHKILLVVNVISHYQIPLFNYLNQKYDGNLMVVSTRDIPEYRRALGWGFDHKNIDFSFGILRERKIRFLGKNVLYSPGLFRIFKNGEFDVVICGGYYTLTSWVAMLLSKIFRTKSLLRFGTHKYCEMNTSFWITLLKRWFLKRMDGFLAYGSLAREHLIQLGADPKKIVVEYNTVDVKKFERFCSKSRCLQYENRYTLKKKLGLNKKTVLYVGQLIQRKNVLTILKAMKLLNDLDDEIDFVIIGSGEEKTSLEKYVRDNEIRNVKFIGGIPFEKVVDYYICADILCLISAQEPYGLVVNEAMSFGCAIVISKYCGASADLIDGNGIILEGDPNDFSSVAESIYSILKNKELLQRMQSRSQTIIKKYDILQYS